MADQVQGLLSPWLRKHRILAASPYIRGRVLDFGCGVGALSELCTAADYHGVDRDEESVIIARSKYPESTFDTRLSPDVTYDTIVMLAVIEHLQNPKETLSDFRTMLADGGRIVVTTPHPRVDRIHHIGSKIGLFSCDANEEHECLYSLEGMKDLAESAGLGVIAHKRFLLGVNQLFVLAC